MAEIKLKGIISFRNTEFYKTNYIKILIKSYKDFIKKYFKFISVLLKNKK